MAILKSVDNGATWTALEYYSRDCAPYVKRGVASQITSSAPTAVICNSSVSQALPYEGGEVTFGVTELRYGLLFPTAHIDVKVT